MEERLKEKLRKDLKENKPWLDDDDDIEYWIEYQLDELLDKLVELSKDKSEL